MVDFNAVFRAVWPSVFRIESSFGTGTGWLVEPGLILTNEHVVGSDEAVFVRQAEAPRFAVTVVATDAVRDIALLSFPAVLNLTDPLASPLPMGSIGILDTALPLMALGYSGGLNPRDDGTIGFATANRGVLSQIIVFTAADVENLVIDAPVDPGDSGGPVLDPDGNVVGMVRAVQEFTASGRRVVGTFYAISIDEIREALPALRAGISS